VAGQIALAAIAAVGALAMYSHTIGYGFDYDDYHFIRPYSLDELRAAFSGPWDPAGIEVPFYRPLTIAFYAERFELFGLNSEAHHGVSLMLFALAATLLGSFVWQCTRRLSAAAIGTALFVVHPAMPYALVAWITNQMHLIETIVLLLALNWWFAVRSKGAAWWIPLLALGAAAFMIKEDGIMLLPVIIALHWLRRWTVEPQLPHPPVAFLAGAGGLIASLLWIRATALEGLGEYGRPTLETAWGNYTRGLNRVFRLVPADRPWQPAASWFVTLLPLAALLVWRRLPPPVRYLLISGAVFALAFNLPFIFVTKHEQMHLVATGAVLVLTAAMTALFTSTPPPWRYAAGAVLLGGATTMAAVARHISTDFAPFGPIVLSHDDLVKDWAAVPLELREYLRRKLQPGAEGHVSPNPSRALDVVAFGLGAPEETSGGTSYRWMSEPTIEIHVSPDVRRVDIPLRHAIDAFGEPVRFDITVDGRRADERVLETDDWYQSRVAMPSTLPPWTRRMHRVHIRIPHIWRPSEVIPGSTDRRALGLQVGRIAPR
jgi:hypothetical protein